MRRLFAFAVAVMLTACSTTPQSRFFVLQPLAEGAVNAPEAAAAQTDAPAVDAPVTNAPVIDAPVIDLYSVNVPDLVNRPQMIGSISDHECVTHEFWRWAEPLEDNIRDVLGANLAALLAPARVLPDAGRLGIDATLQVTVDVLRFDWQPGGDAVLEARWLVKDTRAANAGPPFLRAQTFRCPAPADDPAALAAGMSRNLLDLGKAIAATLRTQSS